MKMIPLNSVLLIDNNEIDILISQKLLGFYGITNVISCNNAPKALELLSDTNIVFEVILIEIYIPIMNGFEFIDHFYNLKLDQKHGKIILVSTTLNSYHRALAEKRGIGFIEKPFTIEKLLNIGTVP